MKIYKNIFIFLLLAVAFPNIVSAYEVHEPIILENIQATLENPYIVEGYEIDNPEGDCLKIINSENIIIRNNYFHNCGTDENFQERTDHYQEGYATLIGNSRNIVFENNALDNNYRGFMAYSTEHLTVSENNIKNTIQYSPLWCERCDNLEISYNYLADNGNPMHFWVPGVRSIGIWVKRSDNIDIHHNTVLRSTSDGIAVTGHIYTPSFTAERTDEYSQVADWSGLSKNARIYDNIILDNMEQGVWLVNARNIEVYNNKIRTGCFTHGSPISTEFNVGNSEFYNNKFLGCLVSGIGGDYSFNNYVHDNIFYSDSKDIGLVYFSNGNLVNSHELERRREADYELSTGNIIEDNNILIIGGKLADETKLKKEYAEIQKTYEAKGWMSCETEEGTIDEECAERERAKGEQGVPKEMLFYSSLMENFDDFVISEANYSSDNNKPEKETIKEITYEDNNVGEKIVDEKKPKEEKPKSFENESKDDNTLLFESKESWGGVVTIVLTLTRLLFNWPYLF